jgi:hypothetical protein
MAQTKRYAPVPTPQWTDHAGESTRGLRLAHEMHRDVFAEVEVEVNFRAAAVGVGRHRIPDAAGFELGETQHELAALDAVEMDVFQDRAAVGLGDIANGSSGNVRPTRERGGVFGVRRGADEIKLGLAGGPVGKSDLFFAEADVETV